MLAGLGLGTLVLGAVMGWQLHRPRAATETRLQFYLASDSARQIGDEFAISRDGTHLAYLARSAAGDVLFQQQLDELDPRPIPGTTGVAGSVFFSPDGNWVGYATDHELRRVRLDGSDPITLTTLDAPVTGAWWGSDGSIYFSTLAAGKLYRVSAQGRNPTPVQLHARAGTPFVTSPQLLPGGTAVLCVDYQGGGRSRISVIDLRSGEFKPVLNGISPRYLPSGYLLYGAPDGVLMIQSFDPSRPDTTGPARRVVGSVAMLIDAALRYDVADGGSLVYLPRVRSGAVLELMRRNGAAQVLSSAAVTSTTRSGAPTGGRSPSQPAIADPRLNRASISISCRATRRLPRRDS